MTDEIAIRKNANLLKAAQKTFGKDLVVNAWITETYMGLNFTKKDVLENLKRSEAYHTQGDLYMDFMNGEVIIEFCNGKKICFGSSESGWARPLTDITHEL